jgi:fido (protein-threonine AMPylation protein)
VVKSTKPKSSTSYKDTSFGILPREKIVILERKGIKKAQEYIIKVNNQKAEITPKLILDIHKEGFGFIFPKWAGKFRTIDVTVGEYEPPHYSRIQELVKILCDDLIERLKHLPSSQNEEVFLGEIISLLAWFQHQVVWIHPFQDYNGRIARLLTNLLLLNLGFPILTIRADTGQDRNRYVEAMKAADQHNFSKLEDIIAKALEENLKKI